MTMIFKKQEKAKRKKLEKELENVEIEIEKLEDIKSKTEAEMADPEVAFDSGRLNELNKTLNEVSEKIEILYSKWDELTESIQ
jgi:ATP-binding cassette subfamily F protein 3